MNKMQYIEKFIKIHNNKYDYSLFKNFKNNKDKIKIICPIHGVFKQSISNHSRGNGCQLCGKEKSKKNLKFKKVLENKEDFIEWWRILYKGTWILGRWL